jgi:hypothetical protein
MSVRIPFLTMIILGCATCASSTAPNPKAESSSAAIRAAEEGGGKHSPNSALYLQLAKEEFEYARRLTNPDDKDRADRQLRRAEVDAELSLALARSEEEKVEAKAAIDKVKKLNASAPH